MLWLKERGTTELYRTQQKTRWEERLSDLFFSSSLLQYGAYHPGWVGRKERESVWERELQRGGAQMGEGSSLVQSNKHFAGYSRLNFACVGTC